MGISIGLTRLFYVLNEQGLLSDEMVAAPCDALVIPMGEEMGFAISVATALRREGIRTQIYGEKKKFKQRMSYADKLKVPYAILIGEDEEAAGVVSVKDMASGEQLKLSPSDAAAHIAAGIAAKNSGSVIKE